MADETNTSGAAAATIPAAKPAPPPVAEKKPAKDGVPMRGLFGEELGFSIQIEGSGGDGEDLAGLADRIKGWSAVQLDGKPLDYSPENARMLVGRFPHFAEQLRAK